jgi:hypothetical protein
MQLAFYENLSERATSGVWYPPDRVDPIEKKHQFLIPPMIGGDVVALTREFETFAAAAPPGTHTILLSTEGFFNHWTDFADASKATLGRLARGAAVEVWVTFREPLDYATTLYTQYLRNPIEYSDLYGRDVDLEVFLDDPRFVRRLDYLGFVRDVERLLGSSGVRAFRYGTDIVARYFHALGLPEPATSSRDVNRSLRAPGVDLIRIVNRYALRGEEKRTAADLVLRLDTLIGDRGTKYAPSAAAAARIAELTERDWKTIRDMLDR